MPLRDYYDADDDPAKSTAVAEFLAARGVTNDDRGVAALLFDALHDYGPMNLLVNETMDKAQPVSELGPTLFPGVDSELADAAVTTLVALGSAARRKPEEAGLLPCRVHAFFRGLPGLWACLDTECSELDEPLRGGPIGKLYCATTSHVWMRGAGVRVLHLSSLRHGLRSGVHRRRGGSELSLA